jgi:hypothetical protein
MKKKFTLSAVLILITFIGFSQCPSFFRRNNGNGTCSMESQIKMYYTTCPSTLLTMDSIYVSGIKADLTIGAPDASKCAKNGYVSYCFNGNLPPASSLKVFFTYEGSGGVSEHISCVVVEGNVAPVVLSNFEVQRSAASSVTVTWKTQQEINTSGFEIQRSTNNSDFETIGIVSSKNSNGSVPQLYSFTDNSNSSKEVSFYRIKMIDKDNSFSLSSTKTVKGSIAKSDFTVFPNPSAGNAKITITDLSEPTNVMVVDNAGRVIKQAVLTTSNSVEISNLQKGGYFIKIIGKESGATTVKKLSVIN